MVANKAGNFHVFRGSAFRTAKAHTSPDFFIYDTMSAINQYSDKLAQCAPSPGELQPELKGASSVLSVASFNG